MNTLGKNIQNKVFGSFNQLQDFFYMMDCFIINIQLRSEDLKYQVYYYEES